MKQTKLSKLAFATCVFTLGCTMAFADQNGNMNNSQPRMMNSQSMRAQPTMKKHDYLRDGGFYIDADYLYWRGDEDGLEFGITEATDSTSLQVQPQNFTQKDLVLQGTWNSGVRAGIGYLVGDEEQVDIGLTWTYIRGNSEKNLGTNEFDIGNHFRSAWFPGIMGPQASSAKGSWHAAVNVLDLTFGKDFHLSEDVTMRPFFGARGAWIGQEYKAYYTGFWAVVNPNNAPIAVEVLPYETSLKFNSSVNGYGLRIGSDMTWHLDDNWGLMGGLSGSLLYSSFNLRQYFFGASYNEDLSSATLVPQNLNFHKEFNKVRPNLEAYAGLQWETFFCDDSYRLAFAACYEMTYWWAQNEWTAAAGSHDSRLLEVPMTAAPVLASNDVFTEVRDHGDLSFQGLTIKAMFNF